MTRLEGIADLKEMKQDTIEQRRKGSRSDTDCGCRVHTFSKLSSLLRSDASLSSIREELEFWSRCEILQCEAAEKDGVPTYQGLTSVFTKRQECAMVAACSVLDTIKE